MRSLWLSVGLLAAAGCVYVDDSPQPAGERPDLASFEVKVLGVWQVPPGSDERQPLSVVGSCLERYGNDLEQVPAEVRGTRECRYAIPTGALELEVSATAIDRVGQPLALDDHPVSFRMEPGELLPEAAFRSMRLQDGVAVGTTRARRIYGDVTVWVEDAPPQPELLADGGSSVLPGTPQEPARRTYATGVSAPLYFQEPTIQTVQTPEVLDTTGSPLVGQFMRLGEAPESGDIIRQSCKDPSDPNHGKPMTLLVTGADNSGFFVTDLTACRVPEFARLNERFGNWELYNPYEKDDSGVEKWVAGVPEPDRYNPGSFASLYVYNYSYPEGLYPGDLLWTLSGSVQEFTSTTQLTFPSWVVRESVRLLPLEEWNKYLSQVTPADISLRTCQLANFSTLYVTDVSCGHNKRSMKMESLESSLVRLPNVRLAEEFHACDIDGDKQVSFFCESPQPVGAPLPEQKACQSDADCKTSPEDKRSFCGGNSLTERFCEQKIPCEQSSQCGEDSCNKDALDPAEWFCERWEWRDCDPNRDPEQSSVEARETQCNIDCTTGQGEHTGRLCTERTAYESFGQVVAELPGPGSASVGLDETIPTKFYSLAAPADWQTLQNRFLRTYGPEFVPGTDVLVSCTAPSQVRLGTVETLEAAPVVELPANTLFRRHITADTRRVQLRAPEAAAGQTCTVSVHTNTRVNVVFRDAVPELVLDCREDDPDATRAANCKALHAATFDIVGHLRHVQAARPRWTVLPRDVDDICCHPGPGLTCPAPIQQCQ